MNGADASLLDVWTLGGSVAASAPDGWRTAAGADGDLLERRLLAVAAQAIDFAVPTAPADLVEAPFLPHPVLPMADDEVRLLAADVRRSLGVRRRDADVLRLLEANGIGPHPADVRPSETTEIVPSVAPLLAWWADGPGAGDATAASFLRVACLRLRDPDAGAELAASLFEDGHAAVREAVLRGLATGLRPADRGFLTAAMDDPSAQVRERAKALLSSVGGRDPETASRAAAEMAGHMRRERRRGLIASITGRPARTEIVLDVHAGTFAHLADALSLAAALDMPEEEIAPSLVFEHPTRESFDDVLAMLAVTGSPATVRSTVEKAVATRADVAVVRRLFRVLGPEDRLGLFLAVLPVHSELAADGVFPSALHPEHLRAAGIVGGADTLKYALRMRPRTLWTVAASCAPDAAELLKRSLIEEGLGPVGDASALHAVLDLVLRIARNQK